VRKWNALSQLKGRVMILVALCLVLGSVYMWEKHEDFVRRQGKLCARQVWQRLSWKLALAVAGLVGAITFDIAYYRLAATYFHGLVCLFIFLWGAPVVIFHAWWSMVSKRRPDSEDVFFGYVLGPFALLFAALMIFVDWLGGDTRSSCSSQSMQRTSIPLWVYAAAS
jgi:hypothetical protein